MWGVLTIDTRHPREIFRFEFMRLATSSHEGSPAWLRERDLIH
jgi:hypothetical protein